MAQAENLKRELGEPSGPPTKKPRPEAPPQLLFSCAPPPYFALDSLVSSGPRKGADRGTPHCANRSLYKAGACSVGAWHCTEGGFPVTDRPTTEIFYVIEGEGQVVDADGTPHPWGPGDTVVLPKHWTGRWDIEKAIRKVFVVHDHPDLPDSNVEGPVRAVVGPSKDFMSSQLTALGKRKDADFGEPHGASAKLYNVGPTSVGAWECTAGGFPVVNRPTTEVFYVLEGVCFLTNLDGSARRVTAGDTVVLPKGWNGRWDILQTIRKVFVVVKE